MKKRIAKAAAIVSAIALAWGLSACGKPDVTVNNAGGGYEKTIDGSGTMSENEFQIPEGKNYKFILLGINTTDSAVRVNISPSGGSAAVEADDNVIGDFTLDVDEPAGTITFKADPKTMYNKINCKISINAAVNSVRAEGAAAVTYSAPENADNIEAFLSGACSMTAVGAANTAVYELSGAAMLKAEGLSAEEVTVTVSGSSKAEVCAKKILNAEASGAGKVTYSGSPETVNDKVSGAAEVTKK
ncbi:MAG: DUF2807 domain-containing protein [Ruminococcus sp.]|nr:DUF2807 domain-containing protein [Ruminococcus sp.]MCM1382716.1 DUF2807 domain-containing protein [Muribaculaceae bacterium]MCM1480761.1 DUF2807 domain-containing protein [Muribaculaceae bacterium]